MRFDFQFFQRPGDERRFVHQAVEADVPRRLQVDAVEGGGQVVRAVPRTDLAEGFRPGYRRLAGLLENLHRVPDLLDLGQAEPAVADLGHQSHHAVVFRRPFQAVHHIPNTDGAGKHGGSDGIVGNVLHQAFLKVELDNRYVGNALLTHGEHQPQKACHHKWPATPWRR